MAEEDKIIIYNTEDGKSKVVLIARDSQVWMNLKQMAELFATSVPNMSLHISKILKDRELDENSVIKYYLTTAQDGKRYRVKFFSLEMIIAVGFRVRSKRGTQFRIWANKNLKEYMVKGFVLDDDRLKNADGRPDYFDELLERIIEIRASEKRFYQKVRDLLQLSSDYDSSDKATQMFFAETQNKLLYAVTGQTAAEIVFNRADASKVNMGLTSWKGNVVRKQDIIIAKNYLNKEEIDDLNKLTVLFLDSAELRVRERKDLTLGFWRGNVDKLLAFQDKKVLKGVGRISHRQMEIHVRTIYNDFEKRRRELEARQADEDDDRYLDDLTSQL